MNRNLIPLALILTATFWRAATASVPEIANVAPFAAVGFCTALYSRNWHFWIVPIAALTASDIWLNYHFGYAMTAIEVLARISCFALTLGIGTISANRGKAGFFLGLISSELLFYVLSNTTAWYADTFYSKSILGWWQALSVGHPDLPPTWWFFRNSLLGDLGFAVLFVGVCASTVRSRTGARPVQTEVIG